MHYQRWRKHGDPLNAGVNQHESMDWLLAHVEHAGDACLAWPFGRFAVSGYGRIKVRGVGHTAHNVMCELAHGPAPAEWFEAAHSCGNGSLPCVNPMHLRWATPKQNQADRIEHGTAPVGENNPAAKLSEANVREIRSLLGQMQQVEIARRFGVGKSVITDIKLGRAWSHVA